VDLNGATTLHGPVSATVQAPTAVTLGGLEAGSPTAWQPWLLAALASALALSAAAWTIGRRGWRRAAS